MKKYISKGKFNRVAELPDTEFFITTSLCSNYSLDYSHFGNHIKVGGEHKVTQNLLLLNKGFYYSEYKDWYGNSRFVRYSELPKYQRYMVILPLKLLKERGTYDSTCEVDYPKVFSAQVLLK